VSSHNGPLQPYSSHSPQVFAAVLSRSPSSDGVAVLLDTMKRLVPSVPDAAADHEQQLLNAYNAEGHLRLVEVLVVPLSAEVVISLWTTLDSVRSFNFLRMLLTLMQFEIFCVE
jgi:hypothetical protein